MIYVVQFENADAKRMKMYIHAGERDIFDAIDFTEEVGTSSWSLGLSVNFREPACVGCATKISLSAATIWNPKRVWSGRGAQSIFRNPSEIRQCHLFPFWPQSEPHREGSLRIIIIVILMYLNDTSLRMGFKI